jgi:hypothetical protein
MLEAMTLYTLLLPSAWIFLGISGTQTPKVKATISIPSLPKSGIMV